MRPTDDIHETARAWYAMKIAAREEPRAVDGGPLDGLGYCFFGVLSRRGRRFSVSELLEPRHKAGTYPVRIYVWKWSYGEWRKVPYFTARVSNSGREASKYSRSFSLPSKGRWRLQAYSKRDSQLRESFSDGYAYVDVK